MKYLKQTSTDPNFNMAFDQYCLEKLSFDEPFFYLWRDVPSVIIGLNQSAFTEVNLPYLKEKGIVLARRMTGGGAVYHDLQNLNYSFVLPHGCDCNPVGMIAAALRSMGIPADISGRNDILVDGRKCSGYAKRLWKDRILIHGTLMFNVDIHSLMSALSVPGSKLSSKGISSVRSRVANLRDYFPENTDIEVFRDRLHGILSGNDDEIVLTDACIAEIDSLASSRFRKDAWIYGRSPICGIIKERRFSCGTVRAEMLIKHGIIEQIAFSGDFIGSENVETLESLLFNCEYSYNALSEKVPHEVNYYFDNVGKEEFIDFLMG